MAEYKRQLALLSADPTRTKEAKELSKKISDMEKDIAYNIAQSEATAESERIDEQVRAYDDYMRTAEEDLNMLLSDSDALMADAQQKLGVNVTELMEGSWSELLNWLSANNVAFRNATAEVQEQMTQSWEDTWKKMYGIIDTYWDEVHAIMDDYTTFIDYMKESDTYNAASHTGQESLDYKWREAFEDMVAAIKDTAEFDHDHELEDAITSKIDEAKNWTYKVELDGAPKNWIEAFSLNDYMYGQDHIPVDTSDIIWDDLYAGIGKVIQPVVQKATESSSSSGGGDGSGSGGGSGSGKKIYASEIYSDGKKTQVTAGSEKEALEKLNQEIDNGERLHGAITRPVVFETTEKDLANLNAAGKSGEAHLSEGVNKIASSSVGMIDAINDYWDKKSKNLRGYAEGGLVTHTGLAQVHGSYTKPEAFLDYADTKNIAALTDALNYVTISSHPINVPDTYAGNNTTVGDVVINITQADLGSETSIEEVAKKVGKAFSKQLSKQGLNLTSVSF